jgi:hypothetical protein
MGDKYNTHVGRIGISGGSNYSPPVIQVLATSPREQFAIVLN